MSKYYELAAPIDYNASDGETKTKWINCGVAFPDREGDGFTLKLSAVPVPNYDRERDEFSYKLRMKPPRPRDDEPQRESKQESFKENIPF